MFKYKITSDNIMEHKIKLWMPITKDSSTGKYHAVLSDDSLDRDEEMVGKGLIIDWAKNKSLPALADHKNSMEKWVGGWENIKAIEKGNRNALIADPWFFSKEANPLAARIKKQVDEAIKKNLNPGISIGAIVHDSIMEKRNDKEVRVFTKGELLEATWVPIQSNRNANYGHVAKQFDLNLEENKMSEDMKFTQKDIDSAVNKQAETFKEKEAEFTKQLESKSEEIEKLQSDLELSNKACDDKKEETEKKMLDLEKQIEVEKKKALEKQKFSDESANGEEKPVDAKKEFEAGKLPISNIM